MDGISISNAMKGVIAAQTEKDDSTSAKTYAATDLIQLYANDGTPNGKINRTDFMNAVQASLGSILNGGTSQTTGITKVPSLVGNALGATTVANLASALGGQTIRGSQYPTFASAPYGVYGIYAFNEFSDSPITGGTSGLMIKTDCGSGFYSITLIDTQTTRVFVKYSYSDAWLEVTVPSFYKNYANELALSNALNSNLAFNSGSADADTITSGIHMCLGNVTNLPSGYSGYGILYTIRNSTTMCVQIYYTIDSIQVYRVYANGTWGNWQEISTDIPAFYKNYASESALASAVFRNHCYIVSAGVYKISTGIESYRWRSSSYMFFYGRNDNPVYSFAQIINIGIQERLSYVNPIKLYEASNPEKSNVKLLRGDDALYIQLLSTGQGGTVVLYGVFGVELVDDIDPSTLTEIAWGS